MTLQQLKYFENSRMWLAMRYKQLLSQPPSNAVKDENEVNIEIFNRSARGISLTVDGVEFLSYARQIINR